jgi:hypothetical protein
MALVSLTDMSPSALAVVLEYIYSDSICSLGDADASLNLAVDVISAADLLSLPRLKQLCEQAIASFLQQYGGPLQSHVMEDLATLCGMHTCTQLGAFLVVYGELHPPEEYDALSEHSGAGRGAGPDAANPGSAAGSVAGELSSRSRGSVSINCSSPLSAAGYLQGIAQLWHACR